MLSLATRRTQTVLIRLKSEREQPVNLSPTQPFSPTQKPNRDPVGPGDPQLSEDTRGLRVSETVGEKSGTATFDKISAFASSQIALN